MLRGGDTLAAPDAASFGFPAPRARDAPRVWNRFLRGIPFRNQNGRGAYGDDDHQELPDDLYEALKRAAARHRRSLNQHVIVQLETGLREEPLNVQRFLSGVRGVREQLTGVWLTDELLDELVNEGRP